MPDIVKQKTVPNSVEKLTAFVLVLSLLGGVVSYRSVTSKLAELDGKLKQEEIDFGKQPSMQARGLVTYPAKGNFGQANRQLGLIQVELENLRKQKVSVEKVVYRLSRHEMTGSVVEVPEQPKVLLYGQDASEVSTPSGTPELVAFLVGKEGEASSVVQEENGVLAVEQSAVNPSLTGGESRLNELKFAMLYPPQNELIKVEVAIFVSGEDEPFRWADVLLPGGGFEYPVERTKVINVTKPQRDENGWLPPMK